jgi:hypothetical protein
LEALVEHMAVSDVNTQQFAFLEAITENVALLNLLVARGWVKINDNGATTWNNINNAESTTWGAIDTNQTSNWTQINDFQG